MEKVAYIFPGQGSQWVGMGEDLYREFSSARKIFDLADEVLGFPLSKLCFEGPQEELTLTVNAQPALLTMSCACLEAMREASPDTAMEASFMAGHSLGEYSALEAAGVFDFQAAVGLARERGKMMQEAGRQRPGTMAAVIGLDESIVADVCRESRVWMANINCPGQIAVSGEKENIRKAAELAKEKGAKYVIPLQVSGAFHSPLMEAAVEGMERAIAKEHMHAPAVPVIGNTRAQRMDNTREIRTELADQICGCVQWQRTVQCLADQGVSKFVEIGPGQVLAGLVGRIQKNAGIVNVGDAEEVKAWAESMRKGGQA